MMSQAPQRWISIGQLVMFGLSLALLFVPLINPPTARADALDDEVRRIAKQLRCPICESVSVADSPAELAVQMRAVIRKKLEAGESEAQIRDYFVAAYGESVLLEPPRHGLSLAIWLGPLAMLAVGAVILGLILKVWVRPDRSSISDQAGMGAGPGHESPSDQPFADQARQELDAMRRGRAR